MGKQKNSFLEVLHPPIKQKEVVSNIIAHYKKCWLNNDLLELENFFKDVIIFLGDGAEFVKILQKIEHFHKRNNIDTSLISQKFLPYSLQILQNKKSLKKIVKIFGASYCSECIDTILIYQLMQKEEEAKGFFDLLGYFIKNGWNLTYNNASEIITYISLKEPSTLQSYGIKFLLNHVQWHQVSVFGGRQQTFFEFLLQHHWYPFVVDLILAILKKDKDKQAINWHSALLNIAIVKKEQKIISFLVKNKVYCSNSSTQKSTGSFLLLEHPEEFYFSEQGLMDYLKALLIHSPRVYQRESKKLQQYPLLQETLTKIEILHYNKKQERLLKYKYTHQNLKPCNSKKIL